MHRNSVNLCYTENSYTFFLFFYKMQAHNNYLDQDNANGRLWSRGELQENSAWTLTTLKPVLISADLLFLAHYLRL